jgi:hypothetical protein
MNIVTKMLEFQNQIKIYHWQTYGYSEHQSFGSLYGEVSDSIDDFVEVYMGKYGRIISPTNFVLTLQNYKAASPIIALDTFITYLTSELPTSLDPVKDSDLLNIRDEILASINKTKYLITLK